MFVIIIIIYFFPKKILHYVSCMRDFSSELAYLSYMEFRKNTNNTINTTVWQHNSVGVDLKQPVSYFSAKIWKFPKWSLISSLLQEFDQHLSIIHNPSTRSVLYNTKKNREAVFCYSEVNVLEWADARITQYPCIKRSHHRY